MIEFLKYLATKLLSVFTTIYKSFFDRCMNAVKIIAHQSVFKKVFIQRFYLILSSGGMPRICCVK